jgi:hypothetical protein
LRTQGEYIEQQQRIEELTEALATKNLYSESQSKYIDEQRRFIERLVAVLHEQDDTASIEQSA